MRWRGPRPNHHHHGGTRGPAGCWGRREACSREQVRADALPVTEVACIAPYPHHHHHRPAEAAACSRCGCAHLAALRPAREAARESSAAGAPGTGCHPAGSARGHREPRSSGVTAALSQRCSWLCRCTPTPRRRRHRPDLRRLRGAWRRQPTTLRRQLHLRSKRKACERCGGARRGQIAHTACRERCTRMAHGRKRCPRSIMLLYLRNATAEALLRPLHCGRLEILASPT